MKTEPTVSTAASIYTIIDLELKDLAITPGEDAFSDVKSAAEYIDMAAAALMEEMSIFFHEFNGAKKEMNQERLHSKFNNMYRAALNAAGRSVRLAALARMAIINTETMRKYDTADPGVKYGSDYRKPESRT